MGTQGRRDTLADISYCIIYVTRHPRSLKLWVAILLLKIDLKSFYTMFSPLKHGEMWPSWVPCLTFAN